MNAHDRFRTESKGDNGSFQARRETHKRCKNICKTQKTYRSQTQKHPSTFDLASRLKVQQTSILCTASIRNRCFRPSGQPQAPSRDRFKTEMKGKRWRPRSTCAAPNTCKNACSWHDFGCCCIDRMVLSHQSCSDLASMLQHQQNSFLCTTPTQN